MTDQKPDEIEKNVLALMDKFSVDSEAGTDKKNFEMLKDIQKILMTRSVGGELETKEFSPFLKNFLEEFDNTYADGLPEAIIAALKNGKRADLTKDWWNKNAN